MFSFRRYPSICSLFLTLRVTLSSFCIIYLAVTKYRTLERRRGRTRTGRRAGFERFRVSPQVRKSCRDSLTFAMRQRSYERICRETNILHTHKKHTNAHIRIGCSYNARGISSKDTYFIFLCLAPSLCWLQEFNLAGYTRGPEKINFVQILSD